MSSFFLVALGGAIGASLRYGAGIAVGSGALATLLVNIVGSFALGALTAWGVERSVGGENAVWLLVGVGLLGAFTTFSAFSRETVHMFMQGDTLKAALYAMANTAGAIAAFAIALFLFRKVNG